MKWNEFDSKIKIAMVLMLLSAAMPIGALITFLYMFSTGIPIFVYIFSVGWIILFFVCFRNLKYGMIGGIIWGIVSAIGPFGPILAGFPNLLAEALSIPICPFAAIQIIISLVIIYLCFTIYRKIGK